mmetsp:Transcript_65039/g.160128  ORF Transcript_65039/g.160128 Transcript_65039/m.160128 type:complete len:227 (+) Transcript_65039:382-1062(+)
MLHTSWWLFLKSATAFAIDVWITWSSPCRRHRAVTASAIHSGSSVGCERTQAATPSTLACLLACARALSSSLLSAAALAPRLFALGTLAISSRICCSSTTRRNPASDAPAPCRTSGTGSTSPTSSITRTTRASVGGCSTHACPSSRTKSITAARTRHDAAEARTFSAVSRRAVATASLGTDVAQSSRPILPTCASSLSPSSWIANMSSSAPPIIAHTLDAHPSLAA